MESLSASLYTATVWIPIFLAVRITRHAISPLLAISTLLIWEGLLPVAAYRTEERSDAKPYLKYVKSCSACTHTINLHSVVYFTKALQYIQGNIHILYYVWSVPCSHLSMESSVASVSAFLFNSIFIYLFSRGEGVGRCGGRGGGNCG